MTVKPPFKWAGGKAKMVKRYDPIIGSAIASSSTFVDPFFGAGGMSIWVRNNFPHLKIVAAEYNAEMTDVFTVMKAHTEEFIKELTTISTKYIEASYEARYWLYYMVREQYAWNRSMSHIKRAALLFFMLRTCFNGVWVTRNNCNGGFGTPVGGRNEKNVFIESDLRVFIDFMKSITFMTADFAETINFVDKDTYVYCDPPYRDSTTPYGGAFPDSEQIRLAQFMNDCVAKGANVSMSNKEATDGFWDKHLPDWDKHMFNVKYSVTRSAEQKEDVEVLITNRKETE